jgi:two-component system OmpR family response regulator
MRQRLATAMSALGKTGGAAVQIRCKCAMTRVLIVDDDPAIREVVRIALSRDGFETAEAPDGAAALARFASLQPDLIVLDVMLPEMDGTELCRTLRRQSTVPILFLSSRDAEVDRVVGLEIGGDDYLTKPFSPRELVARVRALLRRARQAAAQPATAPDAERHRAALVHGRLRLDVESLRVTWDGQDVPLTATELGVLRTLMARPGRVFSRDELMDRAYATERVVSDRTIDSHVRRVRAKFAQLGAAPIETLPAFGYRLAACD